MKPGLSRTTSLAWNSHTWANCAASTRFSTSTSSAGNPALQHLASIVRGADTSRLELTPQSSGLYAISLGLSHVFADDLAMLEHGLVMYDALYAWCEHCQAETHNWPPKMPA